MSVMTTTEKAAYDALVSGAAQAVKKDGSVALTADQPMGTHKLTGLSAGSAAGHSVRYEQVALLDGTQAFTGDQSMGSHRLTNVTDPTSAQDAETKAYGDSRLSWLGSFGCQAAPATTSTRFLPFQSTSTAAQTTEGLGGSMTVMPFAGTITGIQVRHTAGLLTTDSITYTVRVEGADTSLTCVVAANTVFGSDFAHTASFVAGDRFSIKAVQSGTQAGTTINISVALLIKSTVVG